MDEHKSGGSYVAMRNTGLPVRSSEKILSSNVCVTSLGVPAGTTPLLPASLIPAYTAAILPTVTP
jgi:hypothetical protein